MTCTSPVEAWKTPNGIAFKPNTKLPYWANNPFHLPCRNCLSCRIDRTRDWTVRIMHESQLHDQNMFLTLTYDEENLPKDKSLNHDHFTQFMDRLRAHARYTEGKKVSYYMCGEYGDKTGRAHYHAIIFGYRYPDTIKFGKSLYNSETLMKHWKLGHTSIGNVEPQSARYVAGYIMKKITGDLAEDKYRYIDHDTGETWMLKPPYNRMSTRPAIGKKWFEKFGMSDFGTDPENLICHIGGKPYPIPKYYLSLLERKDPDAYQAIMDYRVKYAKDNKQERSELDRKHEARKRTQNKRGKL